MECRDQEEPLARTLAALVPGAVEGLIREVLIIDTGSSDQSWRVAEAAGCTFLRDADAVAVLSRARSDWVFLIEPGARPLAGWIDRFCDHMATSRQPARLTPGGGRLSAIARLRRPKRGMRYGLLMPREQVMAGLKRGESLAGFSRRVRARKLACAIAPAEA